MIDGNSGAATPLAAELGSNAAPSVFVAALRLVFVTLPYFLIRAVMSILSLVWTILVLLGSFASPLFRLLSPVLSFLSPYLIPRKFILSISLDPLGLFRAVISIALIVGVYYLWRYVWGGRYTRLPATDPEVLKFPPSSLAPVEAPSAAAPPETPADDSDSEAEPEHQLRRLADILAGIKIFKYLDSRVFFELLKSFSTTTFAAGETVFDGRGNGISEGDLVIVISGHVDLYVKESIGEDDGSGSMSGWATPSLSKKGRSRTSSSEVALHHHSMESDPYPDALLDCLDREEELSGSRRFHSFKPRKEKEMGRGTLLKTLGPGSTVSSLFEILAVFGEQIDHKDSKDSLVDTGTAEGAKSATGLGLFDGQPSVPSVSVEDHDSPTEQEHQRNSNESLKRARKLLPLLTAVAKTSAAVAVLPASALAALPPQAKSTLIHVVLSRFQRTVGVVYDYLGVEEEAWGVMRALNQVPCFGPLLSLPYTIMDKLRAAMPLTQAGRPVMQSLRGRPRSFPAANSSPGRRAKFDVEEERDEVDEGERAVSNLLGSLSKLPSVPVPTTGSGNSSTEFKPARSSSVSELTASDIRATKAAAISALCQTLGAPDAQEMVDDAEVFSVSAGVVLLRQGKRPPGLYFVVEGEFEVTTSLDRATARRYETPRTSESDLHDTGNADASIWDPAKLYGSNERRHISFLERPLNSLGREMTEDSMDERAPAPGLAQLAALARTGGKRVLGTLGPGCLLGYVALLTGYPSLSNVSATTSATVVFVPRGVVDKLVSQHPKTLSWLSARLLGLPRLSLYVDLAMDWMQCRASQIVCRQGDKASAIYVVFSGRLRSIVERQTNADLSGVAWANNEKSTYPRSSGALWATLFESSSGLNGHDEDEDEDHQNTGLAGSIRQLIFAGLGTKPNKRRKSKSSSSQKVRRAVNFEVLREYGQGESFGEVEVVMDRPFPATVHAIRDTEVAVIPTSLYNALAAKRPEVMLQLSRIIAASASKPGNTPRPSVFPMTTTFSPDPGLSNSNLKTVAILPVNRHVPVQEFAERLRDALRIEGASAAVLNTAAVLSVLGKHAFTRFGKLKLTNWLAEQEDLSRMVLYVADSQPNSPWTQRCIRQADAILVVGIGDDSSAPGEYERLLDLTTARKDLVLLHNERHVIQGSTAEWLKKRPWVAAHHHVQMHVPHRNGLAGRSPTASPNSIFDEFTRLLRPASTITSRTLPPRPIFARLKSYDHFEPSLLAAAAQVDVQSHQITSDFRRIARRLLAKSVGLVLGGGGARGLAHVGAIKAFEEAGIEFDIIGGTSQGAFIGGILAREGNSVAVFARSKFFASRMSSTMSYLMDLTYPGIAWFTGHEFNRTVWKTFSDTHIEDTWINFFCTAVNVTWSRLDIERSGYLWRAVRASMSLMGLVPPMNTNGDMLIDGGYVNNLPADIARALGAATIIAVDVGGVDDTSPVNYGDHVSGWTYLWDRFNPFKAKGYQRIPSVTELQSRVAYVSQVQQLEMAKQLDGVLYMHPPTQKYGLLEFTKADEIIAMGYEFGRSMVKKWREDGTLASRFGITSEQRQLVSRRRASHGVSSTSGSRMSLGRGDATPGSSPVTPMDDSTPSAGSGVPPLRRGTTFTASHLADSGVQTPAGTESGPAPITAEPSHEAVGNGSPGGNGSDAANGKGFSHSRRYSL